MPLTSSLNHLLLWKSLLSLALESKELWALVVVTALVMLVFHRLCVPRRRRSSASLFSSPLNGVSVLGELKSPRQMFVVTKVLSRQNTKMILVAAPANVKQLP